MIVMSHNAYYCGSGKVPDFIYLFLCTNLDVCVYYVIDLALFCILNQFITNIMILTNRLLMIACIGGARSNLSIGEIS